VKSLLSAMIAKLESEAGREATEKSYCDEEMAKTEAKKQELDDDISTMSAKMDQAASASATLKSEVRQLQSDLAELAKAQAEMDSTRRAQTKAFVQAKANLENGLGGVRKAISVLRTYYGRASEGAAAMLQSGSDQPPVPEKHEKAVGAGNGIIGMLEVVESDFSNTLATAQTEEDDEQSQYETYTQQNKVAKAIKNQDVTYKTQEFKNLDQALAELASDRDTASNEQAAVLDYGRKLRERCIAKPETYEERSRRREAEMAGLKDALKILENESAFVQRKGVGRKHLYLGTNSL
jgi:septation ring formation regulator EzrA